ncbi:hypothetical protein CEUSTIGMA_g8293.t1 [Chlamydomonas eustigma]|uniref:EGF-like domain-containing protein n=1 Tax=Chlamydomonas eustigma TaxID=1157962 RepID=A0A250XCP6_9CHLO|nr:hypothetical protein CEUSTIGMA_g8293.t1 [Chlamydomonas eustigma]|eukprot:GAX80858.1 hypothetical protein CEUSTIGMA_g8293.t1 [Chlamydomonas eustigma]
MTYYRALSLTSSIVVIFFVVTIFFEGPLCSTNDVSIVSYQSKAIVQPHQRAEILPDKAYLSWRSLTSEFNRFFTRNQLQQEPTVMFPTLMSYFPSSWTGHGLAEQSSTTAPSRLRSTEDYVNHPVYQVGKKLLSGALEKAVEKQTKQLEQRKRKYEIEAMSIVLGDCTFPEDHNQGKSCAEGCIEKGNCNIEDGRCECPFGFGGPTCNSPQMPACQVSANDMPFWGVFSPKNCECYQQAFKFFNCTPGRNTDCQLSLYQGQLSRARCYTFNGKPTEDQWSSLPAEGAAGVSFFQYDGGLANGTWSKKPISEAEGIKAILGHDKSKASWHLSECHKNCSHRGTCILVNRSASCECHKGWAGPVCEESLVKFCPNACSGRGNCSRGFCHCKPPWFGIDCSRSKAYPERPSCIPTMTRPLIYMYELPHSVSSPAVELNDHLTDDAPIYRAYTHFLDQFLKDWAVRTEDPWKANLFFIPAFTYSYTSNTGNPGPHLIRVIDYINQTHPFYNRQKGKNHFIWLSGDRGSCYAPSLLASVIKFAHFGYSFSQGRQGQPLLDPKPLDPMHGCHHPIRDVITAPYNDFGYQDAHEVYKQILRDNGHATQRSNLIFFAGGVREGDPSYSGGVRQAVHQMLKAMDEAPGLNHSDVVFIDGHTSRYRELYLTTKFCLAPHGAGFGIRLSMAVVHGCIPVVIQDHVFQPFEDIIPYEEMSVRIAKRDIPDLIPILRAITLDEQRQKRLKLAEHYRAFIWEPSHDGLAYNYTLKALHRRLHSMLGELY